MNVFITSNLSFNDSVDSKDVMTGFVYVLKSKSTSPIVTHFKNLYKIGYFCKVTGDKNL